MDRNIMPPKCVFQNMCRSVQVDQNQLQFFQKLKCGFTEWTGCLEKTCPSKSMMTAWKLSWTFIPPDIRWIYLSPRTEPHSKLPEQNAWGWCWAWKQHCHKESEEAGCLGQPCWTVRASFTMCPYVVCCQSDRSHHSGFNSLQETEAGNHVKIPSLVLPWRDANSSL